MLDRIKDIFKRESKPTFTPRVEAKDSMQEYTAVDPDWLLKSLKDWEECPESHPTLEKWYQDGCPEVPLAKTKEEVEFKQYSALLDEAREIRKQDLEMAIQKYVFILNHFKPTGIIYYTEPADLFSKLCRYNEAVFCLGRAKENIDVFHQVTQQNIITEFPELIKNINYESIIFNEVLGFISDNPGVIQSEVYKTLNIDSNKARLVIYNMTNSGFLNREKYKNTYRLFITNKEVQKEYLIGF